MVPTDIDWYWQAVSDGVWAILMVLYHIFKSWINFCYTPRKNLENEIILLTGAAGGMGSLLTEKLARKGCIMVLWDINKQEVDKLADSINKSIKNRNVHSFKCDITNRNEVDDVSKHVIDTIGHPTMIINNAGVVAGKYFMDLTTSDISRTYDVNVFSHYKIVKRFLPHMLEKNHGHIVCISSILGLDSIAGVAEYGPSKAAATGFMHALRQEIRLLGKDNVFCTTVLPYLISTDMFKGCVVRFKNFPLLNVQCPNYVTDKIVEGIEKNQITLYVPRILYAAIVLMHILPDRAYDALYDFLGSNEAMIEFVGGELKND